VKFEVGRRSTFIKFREIIKKREYKTKMKDEE
jgi:hypothetical protein